MLLVAPLIICPNNSELVVDIVVLKKFKCWTLMLQLLDNWICNNNIILACAFLKFYHWKGRFSVCFVILYCLSCFLAAECWYYPGNLILFLYKQIGFRFVFNYLLYKISDGLYKLTANSFSWRCRSNRNLMSPSIKNLLATWRHWSQKLWKLVLFCNLLQNCFLGKRGFLFLEGNTIHMFAAF